MKRLSDEVSTDQLCGQGEATVVDGQSDPDLALHLRSLGRGRGAPIHASRRAVYPW